MMNGLCRGRWLGQSTDSIQLMKSTPNSGLSRFNFDWNLGLFMEAHGVG